MMVTMKSTIKNHYRRFGRFVNSLDNRFPPLPGKPLERQGKGSFAFGIKLRGPP